MKQIAQIVGLSRATLYRHLEPNAQPVAHPVSTPAARSRLAKVLVEPRETIM